MKLIIIKIPEVLHSRAINGELTDLDTMFICGAVAQGKPLQTELEKIKAEIQEMRNDNPSYYYTCDVIEREKLLDLLDKHISELKGENNDIIRNTK